MSNKPEPNSITFIDRRLGIYLSRYWPALLAVTWMLLLLLARKRGVLLYIPEYLRAGIFRSDPRAVPGFVQDPFYTIFQFFWIPFIWTALFALRSVQRMVRHFIDLAACTPTDIVIKEGMPSYLRKTQKRTESNWQFIVAAAAALITIVLQVGTQMTRIKVMEIMYWWDWRISKPIFIIRLIMVGLDVFLAVLIVYRSAIGVVFTKKFLALIKLTPRPLHPDKAGGLGIIGKVCLSFTWPLLVIGIVLASSFFFHEEAAYFILNTTILAIYIISITFVFFFPLSSVHKIMKKSKEEWLDKISIRIRSVLNKIEEGLEENRDNPLMSFNELDLLRKHYEVVDSMPVWPYDFKTISRFFSTILIPTLMFVIEIVINIF